MPLDPLTLCTVAECDRLLAELRHRWHVVLAPSSRGAVWEDIDAVLERRFILAEDYARTPPKPRQRRSAPA